MSTRPIATAKVEDPITLQLLLHRIGDIVAGLNQVESLAQLASDRAQTMAESEPERTAANCNRLADSLRGVRELLVDHQLGLEDLAREAIDTGHKHINSFWESLPELPDGPDN
ncbi:hypothetical protein KR51_00024090 [Rubidibacter lacunae KORDI 51-2]|uniref:Uncharacterized protein n=1 Tax=Rubidibacter lacunae KORDI 51-2 TaxID=582515 RepID=U5DN82_9CHRO|nr:hypothetical protein [Rubidibacter lacunae]ERN41145.1 hypothetical protein KR51_00024090 [Rubidibacter lacunae KORDI 51-2]